MQIKYAYKTNYGVYGYKHIYVCIHTNSIGYAYRFEIYILYV